MKAVIIEDEVVAAQSLQRLIVLVNGDIEVVALLKSIEESVEWFSTHANPDLVFMDIHLSDGSAFSIFDKVRIESPVIFTTAYDEYALKAFDVNSIDYLLKPINIKDLERAIRKYSFFSGVKTDNKIDGLNRSLSVVRAGNEDLIANMLSMFQKEFKVYKSNFLIPNKDKYIPLSVNDIAYIYSENKIARIVTIESRIFYDNNSLDEMQRQLDPSMFFRANRQFIISHQAVKDISVWFDSKLSVNLTVAVPEKIIVSRARVSELKDWYSSKKRSAL